MLSLHRTQFPIYPLPKSINYSMYEGNLVVELENGSLKVIDPKSKSQASLGSRRLFYSINRLPWEPKLYKLEKPLFTFIDLLHYSDKTDKFIDSEGKIIHYQKSKYYPLTYHKITKFFDTPHGFIIFVKGIHCRFLINRAPKLQERFAGILRVGRGFLLYELSEEEKKPTRRMI